MFRSDIYAEYKANRKEMPVDLVPQIPVIRRLFDGFRVPVLVEPGMEADDVIATLARRAEERGLDVFIVTADKDARQLISDHVRILNLRKNKLIDAAELEKEWGIRPDQVVDFLALTGDTVDNVPGVPGIGEGFAAHVSQAVRHARQSPGQCRPGQRAQETAEPARACRDGPARPAARRLARRPAAGARLGCAQDAAARRRGLESALHRVRLPPVPRRAGCAARPVAAQGRTELAGRRITPSIPPSGSASSWQSSKRQPRFCIDTETTAIDPLRADLVGLSFCWKAGEAYLLAAARAGRIERARPGDDPRRRCARSWATATIEKVGQNIKYDMLALRRAGVELAGPVTDTMVLSYLLESGERNHNLDQLSQRLLDHTMIPITDLIGKGKNQGRMDQVAVDRVAEYAGEDADATWRIETILTAKVREQGLWTLYAELERPLIAVLARMEAAGVEVDVERLKQLSREFAERIAAIETEVYALAGRTFNINSGPQLRQVLFDELKLPSLQKTPGGEQSTAQEVLEELALKHPFPALLLQHRQLSKLKSTYLDALPELVHPEDGRIHASFNQSVAATGRLSSSDPNLQNIPVRTEDGRQIRQAFVAGRPGWQLLTADYSQIELRILAHYSDDPALCRAFAQDLDIHKAVAARIFHVDETAVDDSMRRVAKTVNFGVVYGLSAYGLASRLGITQTEAAAFIEAYFQEYAGVDRFITKVLEAAQATGRVETILGRRRPISGIKSTTGRSRNLAERTAINTVIQGSAADLIKRAMILLDQSLREQGFAGAHAAADPRRAGLRGARRRGAETGRAGRPRDDVGARSESSPESRHRRRAQLARRRADRCDRRILNNRPRFAE